jgi:hypothetical protein
MAAVEQTEGRPAERTLFGHPIGLANLFGVEPSSEDALAFNAPEPRATSTSPTATPAKPGMLASAM